MVMTNEIEFDSDAWQWAEAMFGGCELGDIRRTRRVVDYAARQATNPEGSTNSVCEGDEAAAEGSYRLLRNGGVRPEAIEEGPFSYTAERCAGAEVVLALQDTTALAYGHSVAEQLGDLGGGRGFVVHSTLAVDATSQQVLGLLDQQRWIRSDKRPRGRQREKLPAEQKESYKWELASQRIAGRVKKMDNIIQVGDGEADIYDYIAERVGLGQRFVVRASYDRRLVTTKKHLWEVMKNRPVIGSYDVVIAQRGAQSAKYGNSIRPNRQERTVRMEIGSAPVRLCSPAVQGAFVEVSAVYARQQSPSNASEMLEWMLLSSEPIQTKQQARTVIGYYECRWLIEEFHKAWKSGCAIEARRLQAPDNLERLAVITAHVAVRLLQLRCLTQKHPQSSCDIFLDDEEWRCLYVTTTRGKAVPSSPPTLHWALHTIAKLGGWRDTKRTGQIGWMSLWKGWIRFQERLIAWRLAKSP